MDGLLAILLAACMTDPAQAAPSPKRGVCAQKLSAGDFRALAPGVSWWYNWHFEPDAEAPEGGPEFVPMLWSDAAGLAALEPAIARIDEYLLRTGLKPLVDGADWAFVEGIMLARKAALLAEYERRLDLIVAGLDGILWAMHPRFLEEIPKAML
jgi:hypothetical protein